MSASLRLMDSFGDTIKKGGVRYRAAMRGEALVIPGILNKLVAQSTRLGSRLMAAKIAGWRQRRRVRSKK